MNIKDVKELIVKEYMIPNKDVYGVGIFLCNGCNKKHIQVTVDKKFDKNKIPKKLHGYRINTVYGEMAKAQKDYPTNLNLATNEFSNQYVFKNNNDGIFGVMSNEKNNSIEVFLDTKNKALIDGIPDTFKGFKIVKNHSGKLDYKLDVISKVKITPKGEKEWRNAPITGGYIPETIAVLLVINDRKPHKVSDIKKSLYGIKNVDGIIKYLYFKKFLVTPIEAEYFYNPESDI